MTDETTAPVEEPTQSDATIENIFADAPASRVEEPEKVEETTEKVEEPAEPDSVVETTATKDKKSVPIKAYLDERRKRQEVEAKLKEIDVIDQQEEYTKRLLDHGDENHNKLKISLSRELMIELHPDYLDMEQTFLTMIGFDPATGQVSKNNYLVDEMNALNNPAKFVYNTAKDHLEIQKLRDPKYKENLEAEIRVKIEAEMKGEKRAVGMSNLTKATAAGTNTETVIQAPREPDEMFKDSKL